MSITGKLFILLSLLLFLYSPDIFAQISVGTPPRHYKNVQTDYYNSVMLSLLHGGYDKLALADKQTAREYAKNLSDYGCDTVIYSGYHFRLNFRDQWEQISKNVKIVTEAFHEQGIKVIEHHDVPIFYYPAFDLRLKHLEWMQTDIRTGAPGNRACPANRDFLDFYAEELQRFQKVTGVDGYMLDEISYINVNNCGCQWCQKLYEQASGEQMSLWKNDDISFDTPDYRQLIRFRSTVADEAKLYLMNKIKEVDPSVVCVTYSSDCTCPRLVPRSGFLGNSAAYYSSVVGWEVMNSDAFACWRPWLRGGKMRLGFGNYYNIPVWSLNREQVSKEQRYFAWCLSQTIKHSIWHSPRLTEDPQEKDYHIKFTAWPKVMPHQYARCLTDTGFLMSNQTRYVSPRRDFFWYNAMGWAEILLETDRQFDTLLDGDMELEGRLDKYKRLILVGQAALTQKQCKNLTEWVKKGNTAIITEQTSLYDQFGEKQTQFSLWDSAGIKFEKIVNSAYKVKGKIDDQKFDFTSHGNFYLVNFSQKSKVLIGARVSGHGYYPLVLESPCGKGKFIYVAADLGSENYEEELRNGSTYRTIENPHKKKLIKTLVDYAHTDNPPIELDLPCGVQAVAYQIHGGEQKGNIYIHIINTSGKDIKYGDQRHFGRVPPMSFPPVDDMNIYTTNVKGPAMIDSPMMDKPVTLEPENIGARTRITIPGELLKEYIQVVIPAEIIKGQFINDVPLAGGIE